MYIALLFVCGCCKCVNLIRNKQKMLYNICWVMINSYLCNRNQGLINKRDSYEHVLQHY